MISGSLKSSAAACLSLFVALSMAGCKKPEGQTGLSATTTGDSTASATGVVLPVVGQPVRRGDLVLSVVTTGQVRSDAVATLKSETQGTITAVNVRPGDRVERGQILVQVDPRPLDLAVLQAEARYDEAKLKLLDNTLPDSIVTGKALTGERLRNAEIRAGLDGAKAELEKAKLDRDRAAIVAPFSGVMDEVSVSVGERLAQGQEVGKVVDLTNLRVDANVLEHDLPIIRLGGEATVSAAAMPDRVVHGRIAAVLPLVDSVTRAGRAVVQVRGSSEVPLRPGMYADVRLEASRLSNRIIVPSAAIIERDGRPLVFVVKEGRAQWVYVTPGRTNGMETEILPDSATGQIPVNAGEMVLVEGHLTLTHDAPVRLLEKAERADPPSPRKADR